MTDRPPLISRFRRLFWGSRSIHTDSAMAGLATVGRIEVANFTPVVLPEEHTAELDPRELPWELREDD